MGPFDGMIGKGLKPLTVQKQNFQVQTVKTAPVAVGRKSTLSSSGSAHIKSLHSPSPHENGSLVPNRKAMRAQNAVSSSRKPSMEPKTRLKQERSSSGKRSSPAVSTPRFDSDESDQASPGESSGSKKRRKIDEDGDIDTNRRVRDMRASSAEAKEIDLNITHAADVANLGTDEKPNCEYATFFTALTGDEDEAPTIVLQYPGGPIGERYQLVQGKGEDDFKPLDEIIQVINTVAEHYLLPSEAEKICDEINGLLRQLKRARLRGYRGEAGAQSKYIAAVQEYSEYLSALRTDLSINKNLDNQSIKLPLVETILHQIYARTVSPRIHTLRAYENGTDNVYGELLPKLCNTIFRETKLKSNHNFVDLGSGVGNVVLQAALQTGCSSHGCEMMPNACDLAELQKREFVFRCRLWGLAPGSVHLERGDFLTNPTTLSALKSADVVLINNQAFTPALNDALIMHFLDLKDGCRVVSLKSFVPAGHRITARNMASPINLLHDVRELEYFSGSVSWTDAPGKWYIQVKDSGPVRRFQRRIAEKEKENSKREVRGGREEQQEEEKKTQKEDN